MIKWGDFSEVDVGFLRAANMILQRQIAAYQRSHGEHSVHDPFTPGSIIASQAVATACREMERGIRPTSVIASVGINDWLLGYIYRLLEEGRQNELIAGLDAALESKGDAHDNDGTQS